MRESGENSGKERERSGRRRGDRGMEVVKRVIEELICSREAVVRPSVQVTPISRTLAALQEAATSSAIIDFYWCTRGESEDKHMLLERWIIRRSSPEAASMASVASVGPVLRSIYLLSVLLPAYSLARSANDFVATGGIAYSIYEGQVDHDVDWVNVGDGVCPSGTKAQAEVKTTNLPLLGMTKNAVEADCASYFFSISVTYVSMASLLLLPSTGRFLHAQEMDGFIQFCSARAQMGRSEPIQTRTPGWTPLTSSHSHLHHSRSRSSSTSPGIEIVVESAEPLGDDFISITLSDCDEACDESVACSEGQRQGQASSLHKQSTSPLLSSSHVSPLSQSSSLSSSLSSSSFSSEFATEWPSREEAPSRFSALEWALIDALFHLSSSRRAAVCQAASAQHERPARGDDGGDTSVLDRDTEIAILRALYGELWSLIIDDRSS